MAKRYRKAVFIVAYRKEKGNQILYLLLKRKLHWKGWEFPKGGLNSREINLNAVKREIKEETGQRAEKIIKFKVKGKFKYAKKYSDRKGIIGQNYNLFSAELKSRKIKLDKLEHFAYKWLKYSHALKLLTWPNQKKSLRIVDRFLKTIK